ncbi:MAG: DUF1080 domain-containing protein [Planctomycetaceae bacterium]|nr:DUF1080 domain-containing protein [Planctomycetaceae bacterium]
MRYFYLVLCLLYAAFVSAAGPVEPQWTALFDGKTLEHWERVEAGGSGPVEVKNGVINIDMGIGASGIRFTEEFPKTNYEIRYEGRRGMGYDFFGALTFPVEDSYCAFINGGWGGGTIGLSCINGHDASDNQTSGYYRFDKDSWYEFKVRVCEGKITVWIRELKSPEKLEKERAAKEKREQAIKEGKPVDPYFREDPDSNVPVVDFLSLDEKISLRSESNDFKPLGLATWMTEGLIRKIEYRTLTDEEIAQAKKEVLEYRKRFR